jgi:S1-C subfamily serine protease
MSEYQQWAFPDALQPKPGETQFDLERAFDTVLLVRAEVPEDGYTASTLGTERGGYGVVIREDGLVLTIGYLINEATQIWLTTNRGVVVPGYRLAYDQATGFGLIHPLGKLGVPHVARGLASGVRVGDSAFVIGHGGRVHALKTRVIGKHEFAGYWEYLLDEAIFTAPPHPAWSGAALISREGKLLGVGSLIVGDTAGTGSATPGNMFVPIERLPPILGDLIADGRVAGPGHPWLGVAADDVRGRLVVGRVTPGGPAEKAGIRKGDEIVGVGGEPPRSLADFYRKVWATGSAGAVVPLDVEQDGTKRRIDVQSINRLDHLKLKSTL